ncbi:MAG: hypothetical protein CMJ44_16555 [Pimelobacter sp.]|nr:hypothetical protein [Pimelobacter sp.]
MVKDLYPPYESVPAEWLVGPDQQPEYLDARYAPPAGEMNLTDYLVDRHVRGGRGAHVAVHLFGEDVSYTYAQLAEASHRLALGLSRLGVVPGDRIAVRSTNRPEATIAFLAAWRLGAIGVLVPATARRDELRFFLNDTSAKVLVFANDQGSGIANFEALARSQVASVEHVIAFPDSRGTDHLSWADLLANDDPAFEWPTYSPDALAVIWHTGGTTGTPKACYHTARRLILAAEHTATGYGITEDDVHLFPAPIGHAAGWLSRLTFSLTRGITQVEIEEFSNPENILRAVDQYQVTWLIAMGTSWSQMLAVHERQPGTFDLSSVRRAYAPFITNNGEWLHRAWRRHGLDLLNPVGSTAFAAWFFIPPSDGSTPPMCVGRPVDGWEARLVVPQHAPLTDVAPGEIGQLAVRGVTGLTYWNRPELQQRDIREGWTVVDDLFRVGEEDGQYWYMGRSDMMISPGGHKVAPVEVEEALSAHPSVAHVAVTGAPDPGRGEIVMGWVVLADGFEPSEELRAELQTHVKARLAPYKYPRRIAFMDELPRDPLGKIVMKQLLTWAKSGEPAPGEQSTT